MATLGTVRQRPTLHLICILRTQSDRLQRQLHEGLQYHFTISLQLLRVNIFNVFKL